MPLLPPTINDRLFDTINEQEAERRRTFDPLIRELREFLNDLPCLRGLQEARRTAMGINPRYPEAFGGGRIERRHWYTFNHGGLYEMQFNIGMHGTSDRNPGYLRMGLAWQIGGRRRTEVNNSFESFRKLIAREERSWDVFVKANKLEIEWTRPNSRVPEWTHTNEVTEWVLRPPLPSYDWILIGRLLRRDIDTIILSDPSRLKKVIESVFSGFFPFWEKTQHIAHAREVQINR
ncbi:MAG: hypothetical protein ABR951_10655 [Candidatus Aminicenantales bacterium]